MNDIKYIVNTYSDMILKISYNFLGNIYDAEDAMQSVLMKLIKVDFNNIPNEKAFIIRVTINTCKNIKTSAWFKRVIGLSEVNNNRYIESEFCELFEEDIVLPKILELKPKYRNVIFLYFYEEYNVSEIAEILGVKPQLISTWLKRGKDKLKILLGDDFNENKK